MAKVRGNRQAIGNMAEAQAVYKMLLHLPLGPRNRRG
jgi:hypothetical protein